METQCKNIRELRITNIQNTQKRIQRLLSSVYVLAVLAVVAWFSSNFESTELTEKINELNQSLSIEEFRPWDNYLYKVSSCFDNFFFGFDGKLVDRDRFQDYIEYYSKENEKNSAFIDAGQQGRYPIDKLKDIYESDEHWSHFRFWSQQDTLVSFLFSLEYIIGRYMLERWRGAYSNGMHSFLDSIENINPASDSAIVFLYAKLDSLKNPFSYAVKVGWNPFVQGDDHSLDMWDRWREFDDYSYFEIEARIDILHRLNMISYFKELFKRNKQLLEFVGPSLEEIAYRNVAMDSIKFSREESDIEFYKLEKVLNSKLWNLADLPDSIQLSKIFNLAIEYNSIAPRDIKDGLNAFYPEYLDVLEKYKLDRISGINSLIGILETQQKFGQQRLQAFGVEVSYYTVLLIIPAIVIALYLLSYIFIYHLYKIASVDSDTITVHDLTELCNAPLIIMLRPIILAIILTLLPGLIVGFIVLDQVGIVGYRSPFASTLYIVFFETFILIIMYMINRYIKMIHCQGNTIKEKTFPNNSDNNKGE